MPVATNNTTEKTIKIKVKREDGVTKFSFVVDPFITQIYAAQSQEVKTSEAWPGLQFHYLPKLIDSDEYKRVLRDFHLFDNYGSTLIKRSSDSRRNEMNVAWLRTTTGQGEIVIDEILSDAELTELVRNTREFIKTQFQSFFQNFEITGEIRIIC